MGSGLDMVLARHNHPEHYMLHYIVQLDAAL